MSEIKRGELKAPPREELREMEPLEVYQEAVNQGLARAENEELGIVPTKSHEYWPWESVGRWFEEHPEFRGMRGKLEKGSLESKRRAVLEMNKVGV